MGPALLALAAALPAAAADREGLPEPRVAVANPMASVAELLSCTRARGPASGTLISAHRGGWEPGFPENALETAANTLARDPFLIEVDVQRTRDGVLVLLHDSTLDRTTTGTGPVGAMDWAAVRALQLKDAAGTVTPWRVPRLSDMIEWTRGRALLLAEVKDSATLPDMVRMIRDRRAAPHVMLLVNSLEDALMVQQLDPVISLSMEIADPARLAEVEKSGLDTRRVVAWTGVTRPDPAHWRTLAERGMTVSYGTFWYIDTAVDFLGLGGVYAGFARDGVDLLATGRHFKAKAEVDTVRPIEPALRRCRALR